MRNKRTFERIGETENSIIIGVVKVVDYSHILEIAKYYRINTEPDKFKYHLITQYGAEKRGCGNIPKKYNDFIEILK